MESCQSIKPVLHPPVESGQFTFLRYGERSAEIGAVSSIGNFGLTRATFFGSMV